MKKLTLLTFAAAALFASAGGATAQIYYSGPGVYVEGAPRYERDYDRRDYRYQRRHHRRQISNGCPWSYTVQDGVCKPYRGY